MEIHDTAGIDSMDFGLKTAGNVTGYKKISRRENAYAMISIHPIFRIVPQWESPATMMERRLHGSPPWKRFPPWNTIG